MNIELVSFMPLSLGIVWGPLLAKALPWITTATGIATSLYGANKQSKDIASTTSENRTAAEEADRRAWANYLLQRGLTTAENTPVGTISGRPAGSAVNTRLPLWMNLGHKSGIAGKPLGSTGSWVRRTGGAAPPTA